MPNWSFLRHAQSVANAEGWYAGSGDAALTPAGRRQATETREQIEHIGFTRVLSSDLQRAHETAQLVVAGRNVPFIVTSALRERSCGVWEGWSIRRVVDAGGLGVLEAFDGCPPSGESLRDVARRVLGVLAEHDDGQDTLVVSHGAVMRAVIGVLDGLALERIGRWRAHNCELVQRSVPTGRWAELLRAL